jgi:O-antigen biosynthesis protein
MDQLHIVDNYPVLSKRRVRVKGKFLYHGDQKFYLKGVTYGTFSPLEDGSQFPADSIIQKDFTMMAQNGINCVRTYTVPSKFLLDTALACGLKIMVGLPWEQHITFLDSTKLKRDIVNRIKSYYQSD